MRIPVKYFRSRTYFVFKGGKMVVEAIYEDLQPRVDEDLLFIRKLFT